MALQELKCIYGNVSAGFTNPGLEIMRSSKLLRRLGPRFTLRHQTIDIACKHFTPTETLALPMPLGSKLWNQSVTGLRLHFLHLQVKMPCKQQLMLKRSVSLVLTQIQYIDFARLLAVEKGKQEKKTNAFEQ